jgi:phospholipid-binding lipoprotein MlaA
VFGPSSLRDTGGLAADAAIFSSIDPLDFDDHSDREIAYYLLNAIDGRHQIKFRYLSGRSPFEYETIRYLYLKKRELDGAR